MALRALQQCDTSKARTHNRQKDAVIGTNAAAGIRCRALARLSSAADPGPGQTSFPTPIPRDNVCNHGVHNIRPSMGGRPAAWAAGHRVPWRSGACPNNINALGVQYGKDAWGCNAPPFPAPCNAGGKMRDTPLPIYLPRRGKAGKGARVLLKTEREGESSHHCTQRERWLQCGPRALCISMLLHVCGDNTGTLPLFGPDDVHAQGGTVQCCRRRVEKIRGNYLITPETPSCKKGCPC